MKLLVVLSVLSAFCSAAPVFEENNVAFVGDMSEASSASASAKSVSETDQSRKTIAELLSKLTSGLGTATQGVENPENPLDALKKLLKEDTGKDLNWDEDEKGRRFKSALGDKESFEKLLNSDKIKDMFSPEIMGKLFDPSAFTGQPLGAFSSIDKNLADIWGGALSKETIAEYRQRFLEKVERLGNGGDLTIENLFRDGLHHFGDL